MNLMELFLLAVGLSMDAFAVAICKGLGSAKFSCRKALLVGLYFGGFQALMPLIGYFLGTQFSESIQAYDHWVAFVLLAFIGGKMMKEALTPTPECDMEKNRDFRVGTMLVLALATSIDALAVGVSLAFLQVDILPAVLFIGCVTFLLSTLGVKVGNLFGMRYKSKAEILGGVILICIGLKILLEHLGVFG